MSKKVLIVEDEKHLAEGLKLNLTLQNYTVEHADNGILALQKWREWSPDLILLDIMMPGLDGISVLEEIRKEDQKIPILILSAKDGTGDKVKALSKGVDDYLAKPFDLEELLLRVERLLLRSNWSNPDKEDNEQEDYFCAESFSFSNIDIDFIKLQANVGTKVIQLTEQEVKLLQVFIAHQEIPLSRKELLEKAWGYDGETSTRTVDNFIVRFRKYFEKDPKNPVIFKSLRSVGYVFSP
ncbi:DNA-binding response regulator [Halobacteriovorax marinus]|uniref:Two-component response regulator n=1 Tax=Halobacteriovorax marinus (strain ATCC BAA-682 / DSM 15412 / SJ) TaxID=862908 RepID=E1X338_HALMS|nr:response regulator transcription factor [Halobacteriovorax marinus]ATH08202.1 DNA-binding response regulator [Halobacteriovorax marinus]CBW26868.1 two-component response regulator [Halobacteriovorax marinus SJ]